MSTELEAIALVGTSRRPFDPAAVAPLVRDVLGDVLGRGDQGDGGDDAALVLDAATLAAVHHRAGVRLHPPLAAGAPVVTDAAPALTAAATARLAEILRRDDPELLAEWLVLVTEAGRRLPAARVPGLLALTAGKPAAAAVARAAGARAAWLAAAAPVWGPVVADPDVADDPLTWREGSTGDRAAWLERRRREDPDAARADLEAVWLRETGESRARLLVALAAWVGPEDEPFLERALDDRRREVRAVAADLLSLVPGSAYAVRARDRALAVVRVERHLMRRRLAVDPPLRDAAAIRDGLPSGAPDVLVQAAVAQAPVGTWEPALGLPVADLVALAASSRWAVPLWAGWAAATARSGDPTWTAALVGAVPPGHEATAASLLRSVPTPWPATLATAVLDRLAGGPATTVYAALAIAETAGHRLPPDLAERAVALAGDRIDPVGRLLHRVADLLTFRRAMIEELR